MHFNSVKLAARGSYLHFWSGFISPGAALESWTMSHLATSQTVLFGLLKNLTPTTANAVRRIVIHYEWIVLINFWILRTGVPGGHLRSKVSVGDRRRIQRVLVDQKWKIWKVRQLQHKRASKGNRRIYTHRRSSTEQQQHNDSLRNGKCKTY